MPDEHTADGQSVFPDHNPPPELTEPPSLGARLALIRRELEEDLVWETRDGQLYCHACASGGYRLRKGSDPMNHAFNRNPDTHKRNMIWLTIQYFIGNKQPIPGWPEAYVETKRGLAYCYFCDNTVCNYNEQECLAHDAVHHEWQRKPMRTRPDQSTTQRGIDGSRGPRKKLNWFEDLIRVRTQDLDKQTVAPPRPEPEAPTQWMPYRRRGSIWNDRNEATCIWLGGEQIDHDLLDSIVDSNGTPMSWACAERNLHVNIPPRGCTLSGSDCKCYCHAPLTDAEGNLIDDPQTKA